MKLPFSRLQVVGTSMIPTLQPGQFLISWNWFINLKVGDLVVINQNKRLMVKRITKIKVDQFFVIGDNLPQSTDSRQFGWISKDKIVGKVIFQYN